MSDINTVKAQIQSLIDLANTTTGNQDTNLTDGVNALVNGFGQGGSGGNLEGLENGYDVMFYDENDEALAFTTIRQGASMNAPDYIVKAWETEDGTVIQFPYTPTEDLVLYANNDTLDKALYDHFGIDRNEYPYVVLSWATNKMMIYFAKEVYENTANGLTIRSIMTHSNWLSASKPTCAEDMVNSIIQLNPSLYSGGTTSVLRGTSCYISSNFEVVATNFAGQYRLDI